MDNSFLIKLGLDTQKLVEGVNRSNSILDNFSSKVMSVGQTIGVAFSVQAVSSFAIELTKLAGVADGVKQAFDKLKDSTIVLQQMRQATHGTVSELDLMKSAVQASNFDIPMQQLGRLFEFAYERAKATGQSVDYLVNSIVVGIGRKSPLILDNLGISAVQLKEKLNGVSTEAASVGQIAEAVGQIASASLDSMGKSAETAAEKISKITANWDNLKVKMGTGVAFLLGPLLEGLNKLTGGGNPALGQLETLINEAGRKGEIFKSLGAIQKLAGEAGVDLMTAFDDSTGKFKESIEQIRDYLKLLTPPVEVIKNYNKELDKTKKTLESINKQTSAMPGRELLQTGGVPSMSGMSQMLGKGALGSGPLDLGDNRNQMLQTATAAEKLQARVDKLSHSLNMGLTDAFVSAGTAMGQFFAGVDVNGGAVALDSIGTMAIQLGGLLIAQGVAVEAFKESLATLNGGAAIAAGVALVAAGSAFKSAAGKIASSGSGAGAGSAPPMARPADQIMLGGEFKIRGADLIYLLDKQGYRKSTVGG